jgi:hypothetical protein
MRLFPQMKLPTEMKELLGSTNPIAKTAHGFRKGHFPRTAASASSPSVGEILFVLTHHVSRLTHPPKE